MCPIGHIEYQMILSISMRDSSIRIRKKDIKMNKKKSNYSNTKKDFSTTTKNHLKSTCLPGCLIQREREVFVCLIKIDCFKV